MYIAMNRFLVAPGHEAAFEAMWLGRDSQLHSLPGFTKFHKLKTPAENGTRLYALHTVWETEQHFQRWTRSEQFRASQARADGAPQLTAGHPRFEGFAVIQHIDGSETPAAAQLRSGARPDT